MFVTPSQLHKLPQSTGIYIFKDNQDSIIYIGKALNLKSRVSSYFRKKNDAEKSVLIAKATFKIEIVETGSEFEALLLESKLIQKNKPKYNVIWRDDKSYIYIEITAEKYPRILLSRKQMSRGEIYGPFPSTRIARELVRYIRNIIPFCTQKLPSGKVCLYNHLGLCNPCPAKIEKSDLEEKTKVRKIYLANIRNVKKILSGKIDRIAVSMHKEMTKLAQLREYENAAAVRDRLNNLNYLLTRNYDHLDNIFRYQDFSDKIWLVERQILLKNLSVYFKQLKSVDRIECYDVSCTSGKLATGSMVTFTGNHPDKSRYRRFRIRSKETPDDYQMLREVFFRRFKHRDWQFPDLIMVDGGSSQLEVLLQALKFNNLNIPAIALAKKFEIIYLKSGGQIRTLKLSDDSHALNLLKRVRDESHRFALDYHRSLRMKNLLGILPN